MMEVTVNVVCQIDADDPDEVPEPDEMVAACVEAIDKAVRFMEGSGFEHRLAQVVSIGIVAVEKEEIY